MYNTITVLRSSDNINIYYPLFTLAAQSDFFNDLLHMPINNEPIMIPFTAEEIYCFLKYLDTRHTKNQTFMWFDHEPTLEEILNFCINICTVADYVCISRNQRECQLLEEMIHAVYGIDIDMMGKYIPSEGDIQYWSVIKHAFISLLNYYREHEPACLLFLPDDIINAYNTKYNIKDEWWAPLNKYQLWNNEDDTSDDTSKD